MKTRYSNFDDWDKGFPEIPEDIKSVLTIFDKIRENPENYDPSSLQALMDRCLWFGDWLLYDYLGNYKKKT